MEITDIKIDGILKVGTPLSLDYNVVDEYNDGNLSKIEWYRDDELINDIKVLEEYFKNEFQNESRTTGKGDGNSPFVEYCTLWLLFCRKYWQFVGGK